MFIFGTAQLISGIFISTTRTSVTVSTGYSLIAAGIATMYAALNTEWAEDEKRKLELKKIEEMACKGLL